MRCLIACEYSGRVREAFRRRGHEAWSCDLLPAEDGSPFHIQGDVMDVIEAGCHAGSHTPYLPAMWDVMVAHPPCTHLAVSGSRWFEEKRASGEQQEAIEFFLALARAPIPRIAIENPVCIMSSVWRPPDQVLQPWQFGHGEVKATCLWLKGLPPLVPTKIVSGRHPRVHLMPPSQDRWKDRSRTYEGIAEAMGSQWSNYTDLVTEMEAA